MALESSRIGELPERLNELTLWRDWDYVTSMIASLRRYLFEYHTIPEWNFLLCGGKPELANPNSWVLAWPSLFAYLFSPNWAVILFTLTLVLAGLSGYYLLFRLLTHGITDDHAGRAARIGSGAAAIVSVFNGYFASHFNQGHINFSLFHLMPWLMFMFLTLCRSIRRGEVDLWKWWGLLLVTWMFFTTAMPHGIFHYYPAFILLVGLSLVHYGWRTVASAILPHVLGIGCSLYRLGAVAGWQMQFPRQGIKEEDYRLLDVLSFSWRWITDYSAEKLTEVFFPNQVWGYWEYNNYLGPFALLFASLGALLLIRRKNGHMLLALAIGCISAGLFLSLGNADRLAPAHLFRSLPILSGLRVFTRFQILFNFGVATLIAYTFCDPLGKHLGRARTAVSVLFATAIIIPPISITEVLIREIRATPSQAITASYPAVAKDASPQVLIPYDIGHQTALIEQGYWVLQCYEPMSLGTSWIGGPIVRGVPEPLSTPPVLSAPVLRYDRLELPLTPDANPSLARLRIGLPATYSSNLQLAQDSNKQIFFVRTPNNNSLHLRSIINSDRPGLVASLLAFFVSLFFSIKRIDQKESLVGNWKSRLSQFANDPFLFSLGNALLIVMPLLLGVATWTEKTEMTAYVMLGTVFPGVFMAGFRAGISWRFVVTTLAACGASIFLAWQFSWAATLCAGIQLALVLFFLGRSIDIGFLTSISLVSLISWSAMPGLIWWSKAQNIIWDAPLMWGIILGMISLLSSLWLLPSKASRPHAIHWLGVITVIAGLGWLSFRTVDLFNPTAFHHWGVLVATVDAVRRGAVLLWDFPSQYGLLSILTLVKLPTASPWDGLYVGQGIFVWLSSIVLFCLLFSAFPGWRGLFTGALLTVILTFGVPGSRNIDLAPTVYPSIGGFRFFWCYALIGLLVLQAWHATRLIQRQITFRLLGTFVWICGVLWSAESAAFVSTVWLPAFAISVAGSGSFWQRIKRASVWMLLPMTALGLTLLIVSGIYLWQFGHGPDWARYADFVRSSYFALPMDLEGAAWVILLMLILAALLFVSLERQTDTREVDKAVGYGIFGLIFAVASYYVGRSHANNILNLAPFFGILFAVNAHVARLHPPIKRICSIIAFGIIPFMGIGSAISFGDPKFWPQIKASLAYSPWQGVDSLLPTADEDMVTLFRKAAIGINDRVVYLSPDHQLNPLPVIDGLVSRPPLIPSTAIIPLSEEAREIYLSRFLAKQPCDGWIVANKAAVGTNLIEAELWLSKSLEKSCKIGQIVESGAWFAQKLMPKS